MTNNSSSESWYYYTNNQKLGPVSGQDIKRLASTGEITHQTIIEHNGKQDRAENVKGLTFLPTPVVTSSQSSGDFQLPSVPDFSPVGESTGKRSGKNTAKHHKRIDEAPICPINPLDIISLSLGVSACVLASIPLTTGRAIDAAIVGIVISVIAIVVQMLKPHKTSMSFPLTGVVICIIAILLALYVRDYTEKEIDKIFHGFNEPGNSISNPDIFALTHYPTPIRQDRKPV